MVPYMFCNFYLEKNLKIANNSSTTKAREKISAYLESSELYNFYVCLTKFKKNQFFFIKLAEDFY
jgi:hypothetical protein